MPDHPAAIPNAALKPLAPLIGEWSTTGTHPLVPNVTLHGISTFKWLEGGAFLIWHSSIDYESFPAGIAIFGSDDLGGRCDGTEYYMLWFDERGTSRKYNVSIEGEGEGGGLMVKWWRDAPEFSQRNVWILNEDGDRIEGKGEMSRKGGEWEGDLSLDFRRVK